MLFTLTFNDNIIFFYVKITFFNGNYILLDPEGFYMNCFGF